MNAVGIINYEKLLVSNLANGERFETYAILGARVSGVCCLNGAAAFKGKIGDRLIIMTWCTLNESEIPNHQPRIVRLDATNKIVATAV